MKLIQGTLTCVERRHTGFRRYDGGEVLSCLWMDTD